MGVVDDVAVVVVVVFVVYDDWDAGKTHWDFGGYVKRERERENKKGGLVSLTNSTRATGF